jgi:hypothetical protein
MAPLNPRRLLTWVAMLEDENRTDALQGGAALIAAAREDAVISPGQEDELALAVLALYERGLVRLDYPLLDVDQGVEVFAGNPSFHLTQARAIEASAEGRSTLAPDRPAQVLNISDSTIGQLAMRDIHNTATLAVFVQSLELAIDRADAPAQAKAEARSWLKRFRLAARAGGEVAKSTGVELLAKVITEALGIKA